VCNEIRYSLIGSLTADVHFAGRNTSSASADATSSLFKLSLSRFQREVAELIMLMSADHLVINFDRVASDEL